MHTHTDAHADGRKHTSMHTYIALMFSHTYTHTHTIPLHPLHTHTVSYVSYLTTMNQFRNKDSDKNSVCVRTLSLTDFILPNA